MQIEQLRIAICWFQTLFLDTLVTIKFKGAYFSLTRRSVVFNSWIINSQKATKVFSICHHESYFVWRYIALPPLCFTFPFCLKQNLGQGHKKRTKVRRSSREEEERLLTSLGQGLTFTTHNVENWVKKVSFLITFELLNESHYLTTFLRRFWPFW